MKIGISALGRLSEDTGGRTYIVHFLRELASAHSQHTFVLFVSDGEAALLGIASNEWIRVVAIPNSRRTSFHKVFAEQFLLPKYIANEKIDVMYYPGNFISLLSKVPSVVNIRSVAHYYGAEYGIRGSRRIIRSMIMPASARKASAIITPSEDIKRDVVRFAKADAAKITVIPHGVDLTLFDGDANRKSSEGYEILKKYDLTSGNYLLYVSALWRYKRQDQLIRAHAQLVRETLESPIITKDQPVIPAKAGIQPVSDSQVMDSRVRGNDRSNLKLVLAGMGTGTEQKYIDELHLLPKELGTDDLVVFTGGLPQSELRYLYAHASAFVFPSSYESFGNPIFEAWASGIPVAVANVHSFPEIVGDAGVFFDNNDVRDIRDKILRLLSDSELAADLVKRGAERVKEFTWSRAVSRTLSLIESVSPENFQ